jgi:predicted AlkP superfamily pyrophosphatase or phosphodiesterase
MKEKTLVIFLDAVREDYITKENTPFLYDFKNQNTYLDLISLL